MMRNRIWEQFDAVFKTFDSIFGKELKKEFTGSGKVLTHILCKGNCGKTIFKLVKGSEPFS